MTDTSSFLKTLYGELNSDERIELRFIGDSPKTCFYDSLEGVAQAALLQAHDLDVFFGIATRDGNGGKKDNIVRIPALWADLDDKNPDDPPQARIERASLAPSAIISSGKGLHAYWFLNEPLGKESIAQVEGVNKAIAKALGGDSVWDVARVLRLPDTFNHKYDEPLPVNLTKLDIDRRFTIGELQAAFPLSIPEVKELKVSPDETKAHGGSKLPCRDHIWQGVDEGSRNSAAFQLAVDLKKQGIPQDVARDTLGKWNNRNHPPLTVDELTNTITGVYSTSYAGLGCDKQPFLEFCQPNCPVRCKSTTEGPVQPPQFDLEESAGPLALWTWQALLKREVTPPEFVVDGLIPRRGVTMLTGEGGIGKSWVAIELAYSVGSGSRFLGQFDCLEGPVLIVDLENDESTIARRAQKITTGRMELDGKSEYISAFIVRKDDLGQATLHIDDEKGKKKLCETIEGCSPVLMIVDPLVAVHSKDENDNMAMRQVIMTLQEIARHYNLAVLIIHHPRKRGVINDGGQMIRGASDLRNAVDSHLFIRKVSKEQAIIEHDKSRHAPPVAKFTIEMTDSEDGLATYIRYSGSTTESMEKEAAARECLISILQESGECKRSQLLGKADAEGVSKSTAERALRNLLTERKVIQPEERGAYRLNNTQAELALT
jgi:KaiC/GvpD/RAD55 family RecA-like ATPase